MKKSNHSVGLISLLLIAMLCGCNLPTPSTPGTAPTTPPIDGLDSSQCSNLYFPVVYRATWDYSSTGSSMGDYTFSYQIGNVREDGFTMDIEYSSGVFASEEWSCANGDLTMLDPGGGAAGSLATLNGVTAQIDTDDNVGITLPGTINMSDTWQQVLNIEGSVRLPDGREGSASGTYTASYEAVGNEEVTVPAGTFEAIRIDVVMVYDLIVTVEDLEVPVTTGATQNLWYKPGVGLVQVFSTSDTMLNETIVLMRYIIP